MTDPQTPDHSPSPVNPEMLRALHGIEQHLQALREHPFIAVYGSTPRMLLLQFLKGAAFGLGSVLGAGLILSFVVYLLSQIQFVPILGELIKEILAQIQHHP